MPTMTKELSNGTSKLNCMNLAQGTGASQRVNVYVLPYEPEDKEYEEGGHQPTRFFQE